MPTPPYVLELRRHVGNALLWLPGTTAVVLRPGPDGADEVLCCQRADNGSWTPVCGIVEPGEEPHVAAVREAMEETGVTIEVERLVWTSTTGVMTYDNGDAADYLDHTYRCRWVSGEPYVADDESRAVGWFGLDALPEPMTPIQRRRILVAAGNPGEVLLGVEAARRFLGPRDPEAC